MLSLGSARCRPCGGDGQGAERGDHHQQGDHRGSAHQPGPAHPVVEDAPIVVATRNVAAHPAGEGLGLEQSEQGRQQGEGDQHGDQHGGRGPQPHRGHERDADDGQRGERDDHGQPGEGDGGAGGPDGSTHRFGSPVLAEHLELGAVPGQDEQRVVDADREADHRGQTRGARGDVGERRHRADAECADADADQRGQQGQPGCHQRAEGQDQDDEGDGDTDQLGRPTGLLCLQPAAVGLHLQTVLPGLVHRVRHGGLGGGLDVDRGQHVEVPADQPDPAVR